MEAGCNSDKIEMYLLILPFGIRISPLQHRRSKAYRGSLTSPAGALYSAAQVISVLDMRVRGNSAWYRRYFSPQYRHSDQIKCLRSAQFSFLYDDFSVHLVFSAARLASGAVTEVG